MATACADSSHKAKGLTPAQGFATDLDRRAIFGLMRDAGNTEQIRENADAVRRFEPLKQAEIDELRDAVLASNPTMCPGCDGRCSLAVGFAGSSLVFGFSQPALA